MAMVRVREKTSSFKENIVVQIRFKSESFFFPHPIISLLCTTQAVDAKISYFYCLNEKL